MELILGITIPLDATALAFALAVGFIAGLVKGVVGFGMPMILISGLSSVVSPELALAGLILPTLATNGIQALRQGWSAAWASTRRFQLFLIAGFISLMIAAQFVRVLPQSVMFLIIGTPIIVFVVVQLTGRELRLPAASQRIEVGVGLFAGFMGGLSGIWGPPTVAYLTATNTPKADQMRVQGVIYGLGAVALTFAHIQSGVFRWETAPLSVVMIFPSLIGMAIGDAVQSRIDQVMFRKATLWVLLIVGLNLVRRGFL
ncbi:hypothetical protein FHS72_000287 [Loktanella ponticola]|uniref:Probable membrane transporter protein n=1 Tax=Yoonia ponticola TaxID=1524255 RepID=A0A7W9EWJ9_9RHOB|nr:sulfite exporter TauE/SafE family protein [Yoonia ponticola]MBB5720683.1 hypothetical protein [Yoonia ponticola]